MFLIHACFDHTPYTSIIGIDQSGLFLRNLTEIGKQADFQFGLVHFPNIAPGNVNRIFLVL